MIFASKSLVSRGVSSAILDLDTEGRLKTIIIDRTWVANHKNRRPS